MWNASDKSDSVKFVSVPAHLYHILFELFKNALRATVEAHEDDTELPEVDVLVVKSNNDVTVKISDQVGEGTEDMLRWLHLHVCCGLEH